MFMSKTCPWSIQIFFSAVKIENLVRKKKDIFNIFTQNIDCGYKLESPHQGHFHDDF